MRYRGPRERKHRIIYLQGMIRFAFLLSLWDVYIAKVWSIKLPRQVAPKFLPTPQNVTVHKGELANLVCRIQNLGPKLVVWRKWMDEHPLTVGEDTFAPSGEYKVDHAKISNKETKWNLLIKNVQPRHEGVYECQISAKGMYTRLISLKVIHEPVQRKPHLIISGTEFVNQYSDIRLKCNATGMNRAPDGIDWFFNGNRIHNSNPHWHNRIKIVNERPVPGRSYVSELIVHHSTVEDMGNYVCRSSDLNVNSMKVHILNAPRKNPIVPRAPGEENKYERSDVKYNNGVRESPKPITNMFLFCVCCLVFRLTTSEEILQKGEIIRHE